MEASGQRGKVRARERRNAGKGITGNAPRVCRGYGRKQGHWIGRRKGSKVNGERQAQRNAEKGKRHSTDE
jgi:hypothetical protein